MGKTEQHNNILVSAFFLHPAALTSQGLSLRRVWVEIVGLTTKQL